MEFSDLIAFLALIISGYATYKTLKFNKRQEAFSERQDQLHRILIKNEQEQELLSKKADLRVTKSGKYNGVIKIKNVGSSTAINLTMEAPESENFFINNVLNNKFPVDLKSQCVVEVPYDVSPQGQREQLLILKWSDGVRKLNEKPENIKW
ncbi:hypothetical protein ACE34P_004092 [Vibrio fluvialis]